jgi:cell division septation protein DedD
MENEEDKKKKDKQIPEEELFDELDAMYQRVADIEKEEATEIFTHEEAPSSPTPGPRVAPEKPLRKRPGRNKKRSYRPMILGAIAILFALILGITFWRPMAILQLLKIGDGQQPTVLPRPAPRKAPAAVTPHPPPVPPTVTTSPAPPEPPSTVTPPAPPTPSAVATSPAPPKPPSESAPALTKQEAMKSPREEAEKAKPIPQEIVKPNKPVPQGKYYAIQIGSFREMENVRDLIEVLKKEELDAYWITSKSKKRGALYKVFVGQFGDRNEAAQFQKDKKILKNYPDSFIQEISSSKIIEGSTK